MENTMTRESAMRKAVIYIIAKYGGDAMNHHYSKPTFKTDEIHQAYNRKFDELYAA